MKITKDALKENIIENLYEFFAKDLEDAWNWELYRAVSRTLRKYVGRKWAESRREERTEKMTYLLSFEFLPGKLLRRTANYLGVMSELEEALLELGIDFSRIEREEVEIPLGFGPLGLGAYEVLEEFTRAGYSAMGYTLRYHKGMLKQKVQDGAQIEMADDWHSYKNPWEHEKPFLYPVEFGDFSVLARSHDLPVLGSEMGKVNTLRIWKSEPVNDINFLAFINGDYKSAYWEKNVADTITEFLYPDDSNHAGKLLRLYQEVFFASATIQDILRNYVKNDRNRTIQEFPEYNRIMIAGIHPVLSVLVFLDMMCRDYNMDLETAIQLTAQTFEFIDVSLMPEAFETFDLSLFKTVSPVLLLMLTKLDRYYTKQLQQKGLSDQEIESLRFIRGDYFVSRNLILWLSDKIHFVSESQKEISMDFSRVSEGKEYGEKMDILRVGSSARHWITEANPPLDHFLTDLLGDSYYDDPKVFLELLKYEEDDAVLSELDKLKRRSKLSVAKEVFESTGYAINPESIYEMQLGNIHEYTRQLLQVLMIVDLYLNLREQPNLDFPETTFFFAGKAAPKYFFAKEVIRLINALAKCINRDLRIKGKLKVVFLDNLNLTKEEYLVPASQISVHLSTPTREAGGYNIFPAMLNGAIPITSDAGIAKEIYREMGGKGIYQFGTSEEEMQEVIRRQEYNPQALYYENNRVRRAVDFLLNAKWEELPYDFRKMYDLLLKYNDSFYVLKELESYADTHWDLCMQYFDFQKWNGMSLRNIAYGGALQWKNTLNTFREIEDL